MKAFNGFEAKKQGGEREKLPAGGYVAKIMNAKEVSYSWGSVLLISFDIVEGEYKDFFRKDYQENTNEDKKWRGTYRLSVPKDDGSKNDEWTKRTFGNAIWAIEDSNSGYAWDWNEAELKNKMVGVLFRNREWEMNGNTGWTTECCKLTSVDDIRNEKFKMPKDKPLDKAQQNAVDMMPAANDDDDLPWANTGAL